MVFKITSTVWAGNPRTRSGAALIDLMVSAGIASILLGVLSLLMLFGGRSFAAMANYVNLDQYSRNALDRMSREIRQCNRLKSADSNYLWFEDFDGQDLLYYYIPASKVLYRFKNWQMDSKPLLEQCDYLKFSIFQRNPILGTYDQYPTAVPETCKLVQLSWVCSRPIVGSGKNTESVQSAKVVIRKK